VRGLERLLVHVPHSSIAVPEDVREGILLTDEELAQEILTIADKHTDTLFELEGAARIHNELCRIVFDPERFRDDAQEPMARFGMGAIYVSTVDGRPLRALSRVDRDAFIERFYDPYHASLERAVDRILETQGKCLIIDGHSFTSRPLPFEKDQGPDRPDICIGTDDFHTPETLTRRIEDFTARHALSTKRNSPFAGAITPMRHYRKEARVLSVMIEVNRRLYMNEKTGEKLPVFEQVRSFIHGLLENLASYAGKI
jgi:N-formylglutamate amidohydrolase